MGWLLLFGFALFALYRTVGIVRERGDLSFVREHFFALVFCVIIVAFFAVAIGTGGSNS